MVAKLPARQSLVTALNNQINSSVGIGSLNRAVFQLSNLNFFSSDPKITMRLNISGYESWYENGVFKAQNFCVSKSFQKFRTLESLSHINRRYGDSRDNDGAPFDEAEGAENLGNQGGDDWVRPHLTPAIRKMVFNHSADLRFNDISNMNGGIFNPRTSGHQRGVNIDFRTINYTLGSSLSRQAALDVVEAVNLSFISGDKAQVQRIIVTESSGDENFRSTLRIACGADGRSIRSRIANLKKHVEHFHLEFNLHPENYVDYSTSKPPALDFVYTATGNNANFFKAVELPASSYRRDLTYSWELRDLNGNVLQFVENQSNPILSAPKGTSYIVKMTAFAKADGSAPELCSTTEKMVMVYSTKKCDGEYGSAYVINGFVGGFVGEKASVKKDEYNRDPVMTADSEVCGQSSVSGNVVILNGKVHGKSSLEGNIHISNSTINGLIANFNGSDLSTKALQIDSGSLVSGDISISSTKPGYTMITKGPQIQGSGNYVDVQIYGPWLFDTIGAEIQNSNFNIGSVGSFSSSISGKPTILNSGFESNKIITEGQIRIENSFIRGTAEMSEGSAILNTRGNMYVTLHGASYLDNVEFNWDAGLFAFNSMSVINGHCGFFYLWPDGVYRTTPSFDSEPLKQCRSSTGVISFDEGQPLPNP